MKRAFQGPNGWYVAHEGDDGFHHQPTDGGSMTRAEAERLAREPDEPEDEDEDDGEYGYTGMVDADREDFHSDG